MLLFLSFSFTLAQDEVEKKIEKLGEIPKVAPDFEAKVRLPELERTGVEIGKQRPLSLREVITLALENSKDIEVFRQNVKSAEFDLKAAKGFFEPRFVGQSYFERSKTPNLTIFSSNQTIVNESIFSSLGLQSFLPKFGSVFTVNINNQRLKTDNTFSILSPQENTNLSFSLTQPLLRGRRIDQARRSIEIAKKNLSLTDVQFRQKAIEVITNVQKAYWDLTFALRNLQVQIESVKDAKRQLEHNRRLVEEGQLAPIDIVATETQVANFEQGVYDALNLVQVTENALKILIAKEKGDPIWNESIVPVDPVEVEVPKITLNEALEIAFENRPEMELNEIQKQINLIEKSFYEDQTKPQIDLTASYTSAGIGGSQNPRFRPPFPLPCQTDPTSQACRQQLALLNSLTGSSLNDIFANRYPTFRVGITVNLPLFGNQTQKALLGKALVEDDKIKSQRQQIEQVIQMDVRNALQLLRTAEARLRAAAIARENSEKQYESEQRKLDAGQSDIYRLLERQTALTLARSNELKAQIELNKAIADLQKAMGSSLKANNVEARLRK
ncbi:MAG: TolC family protein [Pyrinomonadaceae bacterium]|nr:TolC family protein [Pyrinomonadaceae bacterium]